MPDVVAEFPEISDVLPGAFYERRELEFIRDHAGQTPTKAFSENPSYAQENGLRKETLTYRWKGRDVPHTNDEIESFKRTVSPALRRIWDLIDTDDAAFVGVEKVKEGIEKAIRYQERYQAEKDRDPEGKGWHPSMYAKDSKGRRYYQGRTSDSSYIRFLDVPLVKTASVTRRDFTVEILDEFGETPVDTEAAVQDFTKEMGGVPDELIEGDNYFQCPVEGCNYRSTYDEESQTQRNRARGNVLRHMLQTRDEVETHQAAHGVISKS